MSPNGATSPSASRRWFSSRGTVPALFLTATLICGSTWLAITSQLGVVPAEVSVVYRFALASALLLGVCRFAGRLLHFAPRHHVHVAAQGVLMFGFNNVAIYWAEQHVTSGLVAVVFSTVLAMPFSTLLESYRWEAWAVLGVALAVAGNVLALRESAQRD